MIIECEHCGAILGLLKGNTYDTDSDVGAEMTGKVFARKQLVSFKCPTCGEKTEYLI